MSASSARKPAPALKEKKRSRTQSLSDVRCNIANCNYAAKTIKTVENHRQKVHGKIPDKSFMDQSVSFTTASIDDTGSLIDGSLDHKTSSDFYHDLSKVKHSTQLIEVETELRKRERSDDEDEEESDKKIKLGASNNRDADPQSQGTLERKVLVKEALASAKKSVDGLNTSESLLDNTNIVKEFLDDFTESQSENETMLTGREDNNATELDETRLGPEKTAIDSLSLETTHGDLQGEELRSLAKDLKLRTDSLQDALAKVENLKSKAALAIREKEYLESKAASKDLEIKSLTEAIKVMKTSLEQPTAAAKEKKKVTTLNTKILDLEKKNSDLVDENKRLRSSAESSQSMATALRATKTDLLSQVTKLKKLTHCLDNSDSNKKCGHVASHTPRRRRTGPGASTTSTVSVTGGTSAPTSTTRW